MLCTAGDDNLELVEFLLEDGANVHAVDEVNINRFAFDLFCIMDLICCCLVRRDCSDDDMLSKTFQVNDTTTRSRSRPYTFL